MLKNKTVFICKVFVIIAIITMHFSGMFTSRVDAAADRPVWVVNLDGTITAGQFNFLQRQVESAEENEAQLFVLVMNTPGGLVDATMKINELFLNAELPTAVLVAPSGAIAASAGAFITLSADIAAMAPGTSVGAAQPVAISMEGTEVADDKTTQFLAQHLRSMAEVQGRPADVAERFVTENLTLSAAEALELGVTDYLANNLEDLLAQVDGLVVEKQGRSYTLNTADSLLEEQEMNLRERLQNWLSDPQISFLVLMFGVMGIYLGISAPGTFVPEVLGAILLIMGIYGIGLFDTNTTGIILLLLGAGLIIAEIFTSGFGVFGIGGGISLLAGAVLLPVEPLMAPEWYGSFIVMVFGAVVSFTIISLLVAYRVMVSRKRWRHGSQYFDAPRRGVVVEELSPYGMVKSRGELWKARSLDGSSIPVGTEVDVEREESLVLVATPVIDGKGDDQAQ
ncbi:NfeD family protein [Dethiobacter alkaliphilus]|uniref:NfeD family protein n=1 Tax=Dethiobacter alkaliphilus TaxID=427926 RepID=UPI002225D67C|nr:nodulation protein NfeD [Dethiobacter alkaliphilus]MCW3490030.1 nodulation protein NfeD [Dethiobacter alkaliphilus]